MVVCGIECASLLSVVSITDQSKGDSNRIVEQVTLYRFEGRATLYFQADAEEMEVEQTAPSNAEDKGKGKAVPSKRFEIKKWNAVAMWSWAICTDTCAICRNNLYEPSIEYQVRSCPYNLPVI